MKIRHMTIISTWQCLGTWTCRVNTILVIKGVSADRVDTSVYYGINLPVLNLSPTSSFESVLRPLLSLLVSMLIGCESHSKFMPHR